jgi:hypothetical protein
MTGVTIDHMVSLVALIAVLMVSIGAYSQIISAAIIYQQNHQVAMKAAEFTNMLLLNAGYPVAWGQSNSTPSSFGLQDPEIGGYSLSPFSLQRLTSATQTEVYYYKTVLWYSNNSLGGGGYLLVPINNAVNYTDAAKLLGVNGSYGFRVTIMPTLNVSISEVNLNPLRLQVDVRGPSLAVGGATLNYFLYQAVAQGGQNASIQSFSGTSQADSTGSALLEFSSVNGAENAYSTIIYARLSGLVGVGYHSRDTIVNNKVIPFVEDYANRIILLAHSYDVHTFPNPAALHYSASFFSLTQDFQLSQIQLANASGVLTYGEGTPYLRVQIPAETVGILVAAYRSNEGYGVALMPWGISALGFSVTFGGNPTSADWVATELRQLTVNQVSYQVKVAVWSTKGYQPWGYNP